MPAYQDDPTAFARTVEVDAFGHMASWRVRQAFSDPERCPDLAGLLRSIMDHFHAADFCLRAECGRAGRCVSPKIDCAFQHLDLLQAHVFPALQRAALDSGMIDESDFSPAALQGLRRATSSSEAAARK